MCITHIHAQFWVLEQLFELLITNVLSSYYFLNGPQNIILLLTHIPLAKFPLYTSQTQLKL